MINNIGLPGLVLIMAMFSGPITNPVGTGLMAVHMSASFAVAYGHPLNDNAVE